MVADGYKQTEMGVIPEDWKIKKLGESFEFKNGLNKAKEFFGHGTPIVNYMDVFNNNGLHANDIIGKVEVNKDELKNYNVKKGDVFFTRTSETVDEIGITTVVIEDVKDTVFSGFILRARAIDDIYALHYKKYCFSSQLIRNQIIATSSYTTRALTNGTSLSKVLIPIPPKQEQKAIATALSDVDELIASLEALVAKKKDIKTATMQQLLTGKKRLHGFSGEWEEKKLGEMSEMSSGGTPSSKVQEYYNGKIRWVSISDMTKAGKYLYDTEKKITPKGLENSSAKVFPKNTLLLAMYASIGKCCIAINEVATSQAILGITTKTKILKEYLYYYFLFNRTMLINQGQQGTQANLNKEMVQNITILLPSLEEQVEIVKVLSDMDQELETLKTRLEKTKAIKVGMMQELLTGRTRLIKEGGLDA
ncbi:restriction endonuclease subunit S [Sulfurimonas sp. NW7]|uniref:restriction endonuclease subunit S n=1 Tax=Sulfurimonas sp. NW7 TaxID=2922727 RepID=UPI003DAA22EB